jgi:hypothetical protein
MSPCDLALRRPNKMRAFVKFQPDRPFSRLFQQHLSDGMAQTFEVIGAGVMAPPFAGSLAEQGASVTAIARDVGGDRAPLRRPEDPLSVRFGD